MKSLSFLALSFLLSFAPAAFAQDTNTTTRPQALTTTSSSPTTLATSAKTTSVVQATHVETRTYLTAPSASAAPGGDDGYGSNAVNTDGGASGSSSDSFNLSKGALIAIIVVVVTVALFGVASVTLYILAKRRQWDIRASIKRASRRLTGRPPPLPKKDEAAQRKRSGIVAGSQPRSERSEREERNERSQRSAGSAGSDKNVRIARSPDEKRGVVVEVTDEERGPLDYGTPPPTMQPKSSWGDRLRGNNWR